MDWICYHSENKPLLLCVDEIMKAPEPKKIISKLGAQLSSRNSDEFNLVISTLDSLYFAEFQTDSGRPVKWVLLQAISFTEAKNLFYEFHMSLLNKRCISDCNGHPRSLEQLYFILKQGSMAAGTYTNILSRLTEKIGTWVHISFPEVKAALEGIPRPLDYVLEVENGEKANVAALISKGIYINTISSCYQEVTVIPKLSPVALWVFCSKYQHNKTYGTFAENLRCLLFEEDKLLDKVNDGLPFEHFHSYWEVISRYLLLKDDEKITCLKDLYGLQEKQQQYWENIKFKVLTDKGIVNEKDEPYKSLTDAIFVLLSSNETGHDMVIFEEKVSEEEVFNIKGSVSKEKTKSYIAINIECKFSYPQSTTKPKNYIEGTRNSPQLDLPHFETSNIAQLNMTEDDIIFVYVSWRDLYKNAKNMNTTNLTILDKERLRRIYTESLSS
ncbi:3544_t:CDS:2 [Funneliformis caledonium]|uniref:3544_t:CDS:1 n=1 Tax=Funneliformis caledonium TaxID=1117310 RepID=A0A9N8VCG2_9GLOM|nr:3544_t:CDS:2 [Funneliformis caledonium]